VRRATLKNSMLTLYLAVTILFAVGAKADAGEPPIDNPDTVVTGSVSVEGSKASSWVQLTEARSDSAPADETDRQPAQFCWGGSQSKSSQFIETPIQVPVLDAKGKPLKRPDGSAVTRTEIVKKIEIITYSCKGSTLRVVTRCIFDKITPGGCPPPKQPKKPYIRGLVRTLLAKGSIDLPLPRPVFAPLVTKNAPLVGLPFFYGVSNAQFYTPISQDLRVCFNEEDDCGSLRLSAVPERVIFDPGASLADASLRTKCLRPTPAVNNRDAAAKAGKDCSVTFQKAGSFPVEFILVYRLTWTINEWSFVVGPPNLTESLPAPVPAPYTMVVKQRQPVVIG
jgi:hypothetical protein